MKYHFIITHKSWLSLIVFHMFAKHKSLLNASCMTLFLFHVIRLDERDCLLYACHFASQRFFIRLIKNNQLLHQMMKSTNVYVFIVILWQVHAHSFFLSQFIALFVCKLSWSVYSLSIYSDLYAIHTFVSETYWMNSQ